MSIYSSSLEGKAHAQLTTGPGVPHELFVNPAEVSETERAGKAPQPPHRRAKGADEELIGSHNEAEDNDDPAFRIAGFKAKRAASQARALKIVLSMVRYLDSATVAYLGARS